MPGAMPDAYANALPGAMPESQCTDGRTDGQNGERPHLVRSLTLGNAHETSDDFASIGEVVRSGSWTVTGDRHPVTRRGERDGIPGYVRLAVMYRDRFRCQLCPQEYQRPDALLHIDHIKPWSAGGSDRSDNLRVLCEAHNIERSNKIIPEERPASPVTWWCVRCYSPSDKPWDYRDPIPACPMHLYGLESTCRVANQYARAGLLDALVNWHQRPEIELADATQLAYCAHCNLRGLTDVTL